MYASINSNSRNLPAESNLPLPGSDSSPKLSNMVINSSSSVTTSNTAPSEARNLNTDTVNIIRSPIITPQKNLTQPRILAMPKMPLAASPLISASVQPGQNLLPKDATQKLKFQINVAKSPMAQSRSVVTGFSPSVMSNLKFRSSPATGVSTGPAGVTSSTSKIRLQSTQTVKYLTSNDNLHHHITSTSGGSSSTSLTTGNCNNTNCSADSSNNVRGSAHPPVIPPLNIRQQNPPSSPPYKEGGNLCASGLSHDSV